MRPIREVAGDLQSRIELAHARNRQWRAEQIERHGFNPNARCMHCGDSGMIPGRKHTCLCPAGQEIHAARVQAATWEAAIPDRYRDYTLESHPDRQAVEIAREWIRTGRDRNINLIIYGPVGTGKTGLAIGILRELHMQGDRVYYGNVTDVISDLWATDFEDKKRLMTRMQQVSVMLIDDLGAEKSSDAVATELYALMEGRYKHRRPTIVTTNRSEAELYDTVGRRAMSRLGDGHVALVVSGRDRRRNGPYVL